MSVSHTANSTENPEQSPQNKHSPPVPDSGCRGDRGRGGASSGAAGSPKLIFKKNQGSGAAVRREGLEGLGGSWRSRASAAVTHQSTHCLNLFRDLKKRKDEQIYCDTTSPADCHPSWPKKKKKKKKNCHDKMNTWFAPEAQMLRYAREDHLPGRLPSQSAPCCQPLTPPPTHWLWRPASPSADVMSGPGWQESWPGGATSLTPFLLLLSSFWFVFFLQAHSAPSITLLSSLLLFLPLWDVFPLI